MASPVIFVSHAGADSDAAREVVRLLRAAGMQTWIAPDDVVSTASWPEQIADAVSSCSALLIVMSDASSASSHVAREVTLAVESEKPLIPVRIRDVAPAGALRYLLAIAQWIDAFPGRLADHAARMLGGVREALASQKPKPDEVPAATHRDLPAGSLPTPLTSFVGRDQEAAEIDKLLAGARLVTLTGAGGAGKTRLALRAASDLAPGFRDGAAWVNLADQSDPDLIAAETAAALDIAEQPGRPALDIVVETLATAHRLLVVDNCEHVLDAAAQMVHSLLAGCPNIRILTTTREPLGVPGEVVFRVPPLSVPDPSDDWTLREAMRFGAVRLFAERGETANHGFRLTNSDIPTVLDICTRLDGIPLAIELAAARLATMTLGEIADRLDNRFRLLTSGSRTAVSRHQTLSAALDWSYDLLADDERRFLDRLSVFVGGFTIDAAVTVACEDASPPSDAVDLVPSLVAKSLVAMAADGGRSRYRLLETVRAYAADRLCASDESGRFYLRHGEYYASMAEAVSLAYASGYRSRAGRSGDSPLAKLKADHANLAAAMAWAAGPDGDRNVGQRLTAALPDYWYLHGHWLEGQTLSAELAPKEDDANDLRARVHFAIGYLSSFVGEIESAEAHLDSAIKLAEADGDQGLLARALNSRGRAAHLRGDEQSRLLHQRAADVAQSIGDTATEIIAINNLAVDNQDAGEFAEAEALLHKAMDLAQLLDDRRLMGVITGNLGLLAVQQGQFDDARALLAAAASLARTVSEPSNEAWALGVTGYLAIKCGEPARGVATLRRALRIHQQLGDAVEVVHLFANLARGLADTGDHSLAARLTGASASASKVLGIPYPEPIPGADEELAGTVHDLRTALGEEAFAREKRAGAALDIEQAIFAALAGTREIE